MHKLEKKRPQTDGRAVEVYRTAAKIILQKGFDGTSVSDIANALGITKAGLYHYIRGKTELLYEIMKFGLDELDKEVMVPAAAIADAEERLRFMIAAHARLVMDGEGAVTILVDEARALSPAQNRKVTKLKRAYLDAVRATLDELNAQGKLRSVDTTVAAFSIIASCVWLSRWYRSDGALSASQIAEGIADIAFSGVARQAPQRPHRLRSVKPGSSTTS
jgi:AcrR family transcriptional regulator